MNMITVRVLEKPHVKTWNELVHHIAGLVTQIPYLAMVCGGRTHVVAG